MKKEFTIFVIVVILVCILLSGCNGFSDPSDLVEEGTFDSVTVSVYARVNVENEKSEDMIPNVVINVKSPQRTDSSSYPVGGGLMYCTDHVIKEGQTIIVTATHTETYTGNKTSDVKSLNFEDASNKGRRNFFSWSAEFNLMIEGGISASEEEPINVTVNAGINVFYLLWNESKSNYDRYFLGVSDDVRIEMTGPGSQTYTFYRTTLNGTTSATANFVLKVGEEIVVKAIHVSSLTYVIRTYTNEGEFPGSDFKWDPLLDLNIYAT